MTIDVILGHFPFLGEDHIVLLDCVLDHVGSGKYLLTVLLSICLDLMDLGPMGSPLPFSIVRLEKREMLVGHRVPYVHFSHPGFQLHYPG